jgi:hypothetical protein
VHETSAHCAILFYFVLYCLFYYKDFSSQTEVSQAPTIIIESQNLPQPLRVFTASARIAAPPMVPARARNLSLRNLSQWDFLYMGRANHAMTSANPNVPMMDAVLHPAMGKEIHYKDVMKHLTLGPHLKRVRQ